MLSQEGSFNLSGQFVEIWGNPDLSYPPTWDTPRRRRLRQGHQARNRPTRPGDNDLLSGRSAIQEL
jgi:hypothetical protein